MNTIKLISITFTILSIVAYVIGYIIFSKGIKKNNKFLITTGANICASSVVIAAGNFIFTLLNN